MITFQFPRNVLETAINWAIKADRDSFWYHPKQKNVAFGRVDATHILSKVIDYQVVSGLSTSISRNEEYAIPNRISTRHQLTCLGMTNGVQDCGI